MKIIYLFAICLFAQKTCSAATPPNEQEFGHIMSTYTHLLSVLDLGKTEISSRYMYQPTREDYFLHEKGGSIYEDIWMTITGPLELTFFRAPLRLRSVNNEALDSYLKDKNTVRQGVPKLSTIQALNIAKDYLAKVAYTLPSDYHLGEVRFDGTWHSCWEIRWWRVADGIYTQDRFNPVEREDVCIVFHETLGLVLFGFRTESPPPKSLDVKIERQDAILKAAGVAPFVQNTPFFKQSRVGSFTIKSLKDASLQVAIPNWLLDPARAVWIRDKPPEETRLCWVVRFSTVNSIPESVDGPKLIAPDILVYIDASTGETVGANFS